MLWFYGFFYFYYSKFYLELAKFTDHSVRKRKSSPSRIKSKVGAFVLQYITTAGQFSHSALKHNWC